MRIVIQRVMEASVIINQHTISQIGEGLLLFVGIENEDDETDIEWLVHKIINLRIFNDQNGVMNISLMENKNEILVVSQFTLHAATKKGNRPSYIRASKAEFAIPMYEFFIKQLKESSGLTVKTGEFGADMKISLINDGPVTIWMDTKNKE